MTTTPDTTLTSGDRGTTRARPGPLGRLAGVAYRRRRRVILGWLAAFALVIGLSAAFAGDFAADYSAPGSDSKAAAIMVAVFAAFVPSPEVTLKIIGVGMAAAIAIDATVVRMLFVPAIMHLLGRTNWWLPRSLDRRLPQLRAEGPPETFVPGPRSLPHDASSREPGPEGAAV